jgi:hypothetical protein
VHPLFGYLFEGHSTWEKKTFRSGFLRVTSGTFQLWFWNLLKTQLCLQNVDLRTTENGVFSRSGLSIRQVLAATES